MQLSRTVQLASLYHIPQILFVLVMRRGTTRAVSHWSHCMQEALLDPMATHCSLGNIKLKAFRTFPDLFAEDSLYLFANSNHTREHWPYFRYSNQMVGLLASQRGESEVNNVSLQNAQQALKSLARPIQISQLASAKNMLIQQELVIGFKECLNELSAFLKRRLHAFRSQSASKNGKEISVLHNEQRTPVGLKLSVSIIKVVSERNELDNELYEWTRENFREAACSTDQRDAEPAKDSDMAYDDGESHEMFCPNGKLNAAGTVITHHKTGTWMAREAVYLMNLSFSKSTKTGRPKFPIPPSPMLSTCGYTLTLQQEKKQQIEDLPCFVQIRRDPYEVVVSGYLYHKRQKELWTTLPLQRSIEVAEFQRIEREKVLIKKLYEKSDRSQFAMHEYKRKLRAPFGLWTSQFINSTVALATISSPGGALHGILPSPHYDRNETYVQYLNRLTTPLGLLAEFCVAASQTLPSMLILYTYTTRVSASRSVEQTETLSKGRCLPVSFCLSEFYRDQIHCGAIWKRILMSLGFPLGLVTRLASAASLSCGAHGSNAQHAASYRESTSELLANSNFSVHLANCWTNS